MKGALAGRQRELANDAASLADVLERLKVTARVDDRELAQAISQAESSAAREIEQAMRQNTEAIEAGQTEQAAVAALCCCRPPGDACAGP